MSLFPDRNLVPTSSRELALVSPGLTEEQKKQLSSVTEGYLRDHRLIGFENTRAVLPVIRQCVLTELRAKHDRGNILPTDNLQQAFKQGYRDRAALIKTMGAELNGLSGKMRLEGALALPQDLVISALNEFEERIFLPNLKAGQAIAGIARVRRPIFRQLVGFGRDRIEGDIPGSKQVVLTPQQEAGLVRHLVFGWAAFGEPRLLLETGDFMAYKQTYLAEVAQQGDTLWKDLAHLAGQDSPEAVAYLKDIATQVTDLLAAVPEKPSPEEDELSIARLIDTAFKALDTHFLVVNPFNGLSSLSENPKDEGRSIWDDNRSTTVVINNTTYRLPTISTLNLAAYLVSGGQPVRAEEYRIGGRKAAGLIEESERQGHDKTIPGLESEIERAQQTVKKLRETIKRGGIPLESAMTHADVVRLAQNQLGLMLDEIQFIPTVRNHHKRLTDLGLDLAQKYRQGDPLIDEDDFKNILTIHYSPGILRGRVFYFLRERIAKRVMSFEELVAYDNFADAMQVEASPDYRKTWFTKSLDVTILDILSSRNRVWLNQFLKLRPDLSPSQLGVVWAAILIQEKRFIESEAWRRASSRAVKYDKRKIEERQRNILANDLDPLGRQFAYVKSLQAGLEAHVLPSDPIIYERYLDKWGGGGDQRVTAAMYEWADEGKMTPALQEKLDKEGELDTKNLGDPQSLRDKAGQPNGPLAITLGALSRIGPLQLLPGYPVSMEDVAHRVFWEDDSDPFSHIRPGVDARKELDRRRRVLYVRFQDWLAASGIGLDDETFKKLIQPGDMYELIVSGHAYHRLYGIEEELQTWYGHQRRKLIGQVRDYSPGFHRTSPAALVDKIEVGITSKQRSLEDQKRRGARKLENMLDELRQLGLARVESGTRQSSGKTFCVNISFNN